MDFEFSQRRNGAAVVLSPVHLRHASSLNGLRNLRRSLSRSPSKISLNGSKASSSSTSSSSIMPPSPLATPYESIPPSITATPNLQVPCPPSTKKFRTLRRATPLRIRTGSAPSSRTTIRRALSDSSDQGNASPSSYGHTKIQADGQENSSSNASPTDPSQPRNAFDIQVSNFDTPDGKTPVFSSEEKAMSSRLEWLGQTRRSSPLKRSEGIMNLDQIHRGSPSAKRKSVSGGFSSSPFDISCDDKKEPHDFDLDPTVDSDDDSLSQDPVFRSPLAPRLLNLRKSMVFKTGDRPNLFRTRRSMDSGTDTTRSPRAQSKSRPRFSLDSAMSDERKGHSTSTTGHNSFEDSAQSSNRRSPRQHQPHPLSQAQALSPIPPSPLQSQSTTLSHNSLFSVPNAPAINFSRSLPIGALRPIMSSVSSAIFTQEPSVATPIAYKIARPDPAAFRSTGLISKKHRNPDDLPPPVAANQGMPDTPCKRVPAGFSVPFSPSPVHSAVKSRFTQPQFGTPSKPFNPHCAKPTPLPLNKSSGIFGSSFSRDSMKRRESFASFDGEDIIQSPTAPTESQSSADELPPTPTKQVSGVSHPKQNSLRSSLLGRRPSLGPQVFAPPDQSELQLQINPQFLQPIKPWSSSRSSPKTPADNTFPDPSGLSISLQNNPLSPTLYPTLSNSSTRPPETPTHREGPSTLPNPLMTPSNHGNAAQDVDPVLTSRFKRVEWYGRGEFSDVYKVFNPANTPASRLYFSPQSSKAILTPKPDRVWIVKKSIRPYTSAKIREKRLEEVKVMRSLGKSDHVVHMVDSWETGYHLYIQTEFCEEGNLEAFLARAGSQDRLDDFRIWKILIELSYGVKHIHDSGFIHLDLKPANVFIDFEGVLKIGDFGMAVQWPAPFYAESEGDRRYIGPDLLEGRLDKPADIFALGVMMVEIASNCVLPDNGTSWQKLRSGDWSDIGSLTDISSGSCQKDSQKDIRDSGSFLDAMDGNSYNSLYKPGNIYASDDLEMTPPDAIVTVHTPRFEEGVVPPGFMLDPEHNDALDKLVHWMMQPNPDDRPIVDQILNTGGVQWVDARRRAGAVVFEGRWGPPYHRQGYGGEDEEMMDAV